MIKGYDGWVGRARLALDAVERLQGELQDYEIVVYSADRSTVRRVRELQKHTKLRVSLYRKNSLSHDEMLDYFRSSKLYLGVSLSDGISTSLLEALVAGCVPIQTFTACTDGWFTDGEEGVVLQDFEVDSVVRAIKSGIQIADNFNQEKRAGLQSRLSAKLLDEGIFDLAKTYYAD
jgi:glycosyltransferase involved in cell wall biosynthesis